MKGELDRHQLADRVAVGGNIGIGFAIPANMAKHVMDELLRSEGTREARAAGRDRAAGDVRHGGEPRLKDVGGAIVELA